MRAVRIEGLAKPVTKIGLGTWQFGAREWGYGEDYAQREAAAIVRRALELGVTLFDTAEAYARGRSERILGAALGDRRDAAVVATKIFPVAPVGPVVQRRARASADRLGTPCIDLYQLHWPNPLVPLRSTMSGMRALRADGVVAEVGVSNYGLRRWRAAERALGGRVLSNQVQYSLLARRPERDLIPWAEATGRLVIAYSPLAQGLLSGRYDATRRPTNTQRRMSPRFSPTNLERMRPLVETLREVAAGHAGEDATPPQVALAWAVRASVVVAIPGASSVAQLESNVAAADLVLAADEVDALSAAADAFDRVRLGPAGLARARLASAGSRAGDA